MMCGDMNEGLRAGGRGRRKRSGGEDGAPVQWSPMATADTDIPPYRYSAALAQDIEMRWQRYWSGAIRSAIVSVWNEPCSRTVDQPSLPVPVFGMAAASLAAKSCQEL